MKKNLLALAALGASIALLAGCGTTTPEVQEQTGTVVEENVVPTPEVTPEVAPVPPTQETGPIEPIHPNPNPPTPAPLQ
jgi:hypothetical protein